MIWACLYIDRNKNVQIREISVRVYDESCALLEEHHAVYGMVGQLMSDEEYNSTKIRLSNQINSWLQDVDRILVWDSKTYDLLKEAIKKHNKQTRYIIVMNRSKYVDSASSKLQLMVQRKGVSKCEYMCEIISSMAVTIFRNNDYFITGLSEVLTIGQTKKKTEKSKKRNNPNEYRYYSNVMSAFIQYQLSEAEICELTDEVRGFVDSYYRNSRDIQCESMFKKCCSDVITDSTVKLYTDHVNRHTLFSKKLITRAVVYSIDKKLNSFQSYICAYIADKVLCDYDLPTETKEKYKKQLAYSNMKASEMNKVINSVKAAYSNRDRIENINKNGYYLAALEYLKKEAFSYHEAERIRELNEQKILLQGIPENIVEMYPAARSINRHFILHLGPTNSGKTYSAIQAYKNAVRGIYLAPLRLLAYEIFEQMNSEGVLCSMVTGEETIDIPFSKHISATVEMADVNTYYDVAVIDECQLVANEQRGGAWTEAILGITANEIHLCASENAFDILTKLIEMCGDSYTVEYHERFVPLVPDETPFVFPQSVRKNDALIAFSKKAVLKYAEQLKSYGLTASVIYGDLPYDVRRKEVDTFINGETDVVVSTDAIGMGLNLPIERIVFLEMKKFDGKRTRELTHDEALQIAGRAGRKGKYDIGYYTSAVDTKWLIRRIQQGNTPISKARLRFPKNLIKVDMPLSQIMKLWTSISYDKEMFSAMDLRREIRLCKMAEEFTDDKAILFEFATIPFNDNKLPLINLWNKLLQAEVSGNKSIDIDKLLNINSCRTLAGFEILYRKSDLMYYYCSRFNRGELDGIIEMKHAISIKIMEKLQEMRQAPIVVG